MKIDVSRIVRDHFVTLRDADSSGVALIDLSLFALAPILFSILSYLGKYEFKPDFYNVSITFFGIFIALLLNIQVAIFSIFLRRWDIPNDNREKHLVEARLNDRKLLLKELNSNISYLIVFSCFSLLLFLCIFALSIVNTIVSAFSVLIYTHFMLTLLMVVKRAYALFQSEYAH